MGFFQKGVLNMVEFFKICIFDDVLGISRFICFERGFTQIFVYDNLMHNSTNGKDFLHEKVFKSDLI